MKKVVLAYGGSMWPVLKEVSDELYELMKADAETGCVPTELSKDAPYLIEDWCDYDPTKKMLLGYNFDKSDYIPAELFFRVTTESDSQSFWESDTLDELESVLGASVEEVHTA